MGDKRKLQAEIDRCLKKVTEGVEAFEDIWKKVQSSNNTNQKEKFEADLKKEIKKLQRLRDQIKAWQVSADIKDKQVLMDHRKIIEQQMEKFKVVERETKTKAYSKEGLVATGKVDPKEKEKEEITNWLSNSIGELNVQVDKLESEVEALNSRKKKLDREETAKHESCKEHLSKHRYHIDKLEAILRMVDNGAIEFSQIAKIQQDIDYYIESNQDADFEENDFIYDELNLDDVASNMRMDVVASSPSEVDNDVPGLGTAPSSNHSGSPSPSSGASTHSKKSEDENKKRHKNQEDASQTSGRINLSLKTNLTESTSIVGTSASTNRLPQTPTKSNTLSGVPSTPTSASAGSTRTTTATASMLGYAQVAGSHHNNTSGTTGKSVPTVAKSHTGGTNGLIVTLLQSITQPASTSTTSTTSGHSNSSSSSSSSVVPVTLSSSSVSSDLPSSSLPGSSSSSSTSSSTFVIPTLPSPSPLSGATTASTLQPLQLSTIAQQQHQQRLQQVLGESESRRMVNGIPANSSHTLQNDTSSSSVPSQIKPMNQELQEQRTALDTSASLGQSHLDPSIGNRTDIQTNLQLSSMSLTSSSDSLQQQQQQQQQPPVPPVNAPVTHTIYLNPIYGVTPLGPQLLSDEQMRQQAMLDVASHHIPLHSDSETMRVYLPNNPCPTPAYYPQMLPPVMQSPDFFNKLDPDSLFFIFYYMEGTKAQYLAAKALKQKSWRFHTKYMMWFQRHEEPKTITDEFEQGTYIYFDYEKWAQRKKEGFKFEYKFLEDNEL